MNFYTFFHFDLIRKRYEKKDLSPLTSIKLTVSFREFFLYRIVFSQICASMKFALR